MNPIVEGTEPNYWLSALIIDKDAMCKQVRSDSEALYTKEAGKTCPTEILEAIASINAEEDLYGSQCICSLCTECTSVLVATAVSDAAQMLILQAVQKM